MAAPTAYSPIIATTSTPTSTRRGRRCIRYARSSSARRFSHPSVAPQAKERTKQDRAAAREQIEHRGRPIYRHPDCPRDQLAAERHPLRTYCEPETPQSPCRTIVDQLVILTPFNLRAFAGNFDRASKASHLVDQSALLRRNAAPYAAACDGLGLLEGEPATLGNARDEVIVEMTYHSIDLRKFVFRKRTGDGKRIGALRGLDEVKVHSKLVQKVSEAEPREHDADRTGDCRWLRDDRVRAGRDVIAARTRHVAH